MILCDKQCFSCVLCLCGVKGHLLCVLL
uniref:Uncharacterized protein n=1 Tax=Anguilla anguilla TaxID=7936 RepID=A0A0E9SIU8_ANGAN